LAWPSSDPLQEQYDLLALGELSVLILCGSPFSASAFAMLLR